METEQVVQTPPAESSPAAQTEVKTPPAESSPAVETSADFEAADFESMSDAQRSEWLQKGTTPTKKVKAQAAEDGQTSPDGKPVKTPASGPGKLPGNKGEEVRVHQLLQDRHKDRTRIQELEAQLNGKGAPPAGSPPAPGKEVTPAQPKKLEAPVAPKLDDFKTWGEYMEAQNAYVDKLTDYKADLKIEGLRSSLEQNSQAQQVAKQNETIAQAWKGKVDTAIGKHADFKAIAFSPALGAIIPAGSVIDAFVLRNPQGAEILYHLGSDLGEAERIAALDPLDQATELAELALTFRGSAPAPGVAKEPPVKHVSSASPPARDLGAPRATIADPVEQALEGKDFDSYRAEMNAREAKARRR